MSEIKSNFLKKFINFLKVEKLYSEHTVVAYRMDIVEFLGYVKKDVLEVREIDLRRYIEFLYDTDKERTTINRKISSLNSFFNFLYKNGYISKKPNENIHSVKTKRRLPQFLAEEEIASLIDTMEENSVLDIRNKLIFEFLYATGMRVSELTSLQLKDINIYEKEVKVFGKGKKERIVPINDRVCFLLKKYLAVRNDDNPILFLSRNKKPLDTRDIRRIINSAIKKVGLSKHITPHTIRHSVATHLLNNGADLRLIQDILGHESLSTTQIYTHVNMANMKKIYDKCHPRG